MNLKERMELSEWIIGINKAKEFNWWDRLEIKQIKLKERMDLAEWIIGINKWIQREQWSYENELSVSTIKLKWSYRIAEWIIVMNYRVVIRRNSFPWKNGRSICLPSGDTFPRRPLNFWG